MSPDHPARARMTPLKPLPGPPELLVISTDTDLLASLSRAAYEAGHVMSTAPSLAYGWQLMRERLFSAVAVDCPGAGSGLAETVSILKGLAPDTRIGLVMGWWDVNAADVHRLTDFMLYKPLGRRQAVSTLRRINSAPFPAAGQRPHRVSTPA